MFFGVENGWITRVNCQHVPDGNVSGLGIRGTLYFQALCSILLSLHQSSSRDIILGNLSLQLASVGFIIVACVDGNIDITHTIIIGDLAVLLSTCRTTPLAFSRRFAESSPGLVAAKWVWRFDIIARPILLLFNLFLWAVLRRIQQSDGGFCSAGLFRYVRWGVSNDLHLTSKASTSALVYSIIDIIWESIRISAELARMVYLRREPKLRLDEHQTRLDPRIWWIRRVLDRFDRSTVGFQWAGFWKWHSWIVGLHKALFFGYIVWAIEGTIRANNLSSEKAGWGIGWLFVVINASIAVGLLLTRYLQSIHWIGINPRRAKSD